MDIELAQIISQIIAFLVMLWVLKRFAWGPILSLMEERRQKIQLEFDNIQQKNNKLDEQESLYNQKFRELEDKAHNKIQEGINEGQRISQEIQQKARQQAQTILTKAKEEGERKIVEARIKLRNDLVKIAMLATQKLIQANLTADQQQKLLDDFIKQMEYK